MPREQHPRQTDKELPNVNIKYQHEFIKFRIPPCINRCQYLDTSQLKLRMVTGKIVRIV